MEKLANHIALQSITEGGMEKQALNVAQLLRMGRNFAMRGKLDRFNKLMNMRAQAAEAVNHSRFADWVAADVKSRQAMNYLLDGDVNPALDKLYSAEKRKVHNIGRIPQNLGPHNRAAAVKGAREELNTLMNVLPVETRNLALKTTPSYNSDQLEVFSKALRQLDPELHEKVLTTGSFR